MTSITAAEKARRQRIVESTIGTHSMEGLHTDPESLATLKKYADGELTLEEFSAAMQRHAKEVLAEIRSRDLLGAA